MKKRMIVLMAVLGFLGVALGAFGAHGLAERLAVTGRAATWETAVLYHLVHVAAGVAMVLSPAFGVSRRLRGAVWFFFFGTLIFSGTLYVYSVGGPSWLGAVTPIGGVCFLIGWGLLVASAAQVAAADEG